MESINYVILRLSHTYILPAVASTFIALMYFSYKWGKANLSNKPLTIFNIFYTGTDVQCKSENCNVLTEPNLPITVFKPTIVSTAALTQLRNKSRSNKVGPMKWNKMLRDEIAKLHISSLIRNENVHAYPVYKVWNNTKWSVDFNNSTKENEPFWDYYNMSHPFKDVSVKDKVFTNETQQNKFEYKDFTDDTIEIQNVFNAELPIDNIKENGCTSETIKQHKQEKVPLGEYYRICYDIESGDEDSGEFYFDEISSNQGSMNILKESAFEIAPSDNNILSINKNISDESQFISVDLKSYYYTEERFKNECPTINFEKNAPKREHYENYWEIA